MVVRHWFLLAAIEVSDFCHIYSRFLEVPLTMDRLSRSVEKVTIGRCFNSTVALFPLFLPFFFIRYPLFRRPISNAMVSYKGEEEGVE